LTSTDLQQQLTPSRLGQGTAVEQSRAIAEVQAAIVVAQQCPRDVNRATGDMKRSCAQKSLADRAFYSYPRGRETVSGPSVQLARELARCFGNMQYGLVELRRDDGYGQSEMQAWAWDVQTNTRSSTTFIVPHKRDKTTGPVVLTDMRDIYENNANNGARRLREMIFAILPGWYTEDAIAACYETLAAAVGDGKKRDEVVTAAVAGFARLGVTADQLAQKTGAPVEKWTPHDIARLQVIYRSLMRHEIQVDDEFPAAAARVTAADIKGQRPTQNVPSADAPSPAAHAVPATPPPAATAEGTSGPGPAPSGPAGHEPAAGPGPAERASSGQRSMLSKHLDRLGIEDEEERLGILTVLAGRQIDGTDDLAPDEAKNADRRLKACKDRAALIALVHAGDVPSE
jgi:hypothetical protein